MLMLSLIRFQNQRCPPDLYRFQQTKNINLDSQGDDVVVGPFSILFLSFQY